MVAEFLRNPAAAAERHQWLGCAGKQAAHAMREAVLERPRVLHVSCGGCKRSVTISPDGSISIDHAPEEIRAMLVGEVLGQPICSCMQIRRLFAGAGNGLDPDVLRGASKKLRSARKAYKLAQALRFHRRIRKAAAQNPLSPERTAAMRKMERSICDMIGKGPRPSISIDVRTASPLCWPIKSLLRRSVDLSTRYLMIRPGSAPAPVMTIYAGLDFLVRYARKRWFCTHPQNGASFVILHESSKPAVYRDSIVRDCLVIVPRSSAKTPKTLIKRAYVDEAVLLVAVVSPNPVSLLGNSAVLRRDLEYKEPTRICRVPDRWGI